MKNTSNPKNKIKQSTKEKLWILLGCAIAVYSGVSSYYRVKAEDRLLDLKKEELNLKQATSVLPDGVEDVWVHYIYKRLAEEIQRDGRNLRVRTTYVGAPPVISYVSLNHPYEIDCNSYSLGISVTFSNDEESGISANITGQFSTDHKNEPERGVPDHSIASKNLDTRLCKSVAEWLSIMTTDRPSQP